MKAQHPQQKKAYPITSRKSVFPFLVLIGDDMLFNPIFKFDVVCLQWHSILCAYSKDLQKGILVVCSWESEKKITKEQSPPSQTKHPML